MRRVLALLLFALAAGRQARAQAGLLVPTSIGRPDASVLSLREMAIDVGIARGYARVNVRQVFENHTANIQEGTYRFRLPPSAAVGDFAVWDDLVRIPGVILEKQRARALYRELTRQRIDPGLLQQGEEDDGALPSGGAVFSVRVAPIPGLATKRLELQFQQEVPYVEGRGEFRFGLRPESGEPPVAGALTIRVTTEDATAVPVATSYALKKDGADLVFSGTKSPLDRDLVIHLTPPDTKALRLAAFRNPDGALPDDVALAPWERASDLPADRDGFLLFEMLPPASRAVTKTTAASRPPVVLAILFDTSFSHRWAGLETAYAHLVRVLSALGPKDQFTLVPFDRRPAPTALSPATREATESALQALRARPLAPGTDIPRAVAEARRIVGEEGRILLLTDAVPAPSSRALAGARGPLPLFTAVTGEEVPEGLGAASVQLLAAGAADIEGDLFFQRVLGPLEKTSARSAAPEAPFRVSGGDPRLRDLYPVLLQPPAPGALSGWVGRYGTPQPRLRFEVTTPLLPEGRGTLEAALPEKALLARDLPRRWARARVDHLLARVEVEGERRDLVDEIVTLSKRYKFVTPYTAFLAAPRSLLRPRRIQPGDPVIRVQCDAGTVSAVALLPFGLRLPLVKRPGTRLWEGRFLVPEGLRDGRYGVRILLRDDRGASVAETKHFVLDGRAPAIEPVLPDHGRPGETLRVAARTDEDVIALTARLGSGPPVPLRWDPKEKRSVAALFVPAALSGLQEVFFEAVDGAHNHGFARAVLEVRP